MKRLLLVLAVLAVMATHADAQRVTMLHVGPPSYACQSVASVRRCRVVDVGGYEVASLVTIPYTFSAGQTIFSAQVNTNFSTLATAINGNLDHFNVGSAGIYPSQIKCTSVGTCTYGSSQTYFYNPNNISVVPLAITNASAATADYFDVTYSGATAGNIFHVDLEGNAFTQGMVFAVPTAAPTANAVWIQNDSGATNGMTFNVPAGSTNGYQFEYANATPFTLKIGASGTIFIPVSSTQPFKFTNAANNLNNVVLPDAGGLEIDPLINSLNTLSYVPVVYTPAGAIVANTEHGINVECTAVSGTCTASFTNTAQFASATSYSCNPPSLQSGSAGADTGQALIGSNVVTLSAMKSTGGVDTGYTAALSSYCSGT